jgi:tetratricopeptide (TPR) repeat protein
MTRNSLAVPAAAFVLFYALLPTRAQNFPDTAQAKLTPTSVVARPPLPAISDEDSARLLLLHKQYPEAEAIFFRLTQEQPKNAVYWNELGISRHNQMLLSSALKCYEKAVKLDSRYPDALNNAGTIWYENHKFGKAIRAYRKAINLRGDFAPFYLNLGFAYFNSKNYTESIAAFRKAMEIDPGVFDTGRSRMGTVIQDRSMAGDRGLFYFMLAKSFAESGNIDRCVVYLRKARDEGFKDMNAVKSDPSFSAVLKDPAVQEVLSPKPVVETAQP